MNILLYIIAVLLGSIFIIGIIWRFVSYRYHLPCPAWLGWMVELDNPFSKTHRAASIVEQLDIKPGMVVLDAGCGPGRVTIPLAKKIGPQGQVVAMDIQKEMLNKVQEKSEKAHLSNIIFLHAGLGEGQLKNHMFDRVLLVAVLGEIPHRKKVLQEIFDALKPGGILSITEIIGDPHYQRLNNVLTIAYEAGFQKKKVFSDWLAYNLLLEKPI